MDGDQSTVHTSIFETIRLEDLEYGEHWSARDLSRILGYALWQKFKNVLDKAEKACGNSGQAVSDHFIHVDKMITIGKGGQRKIDDVYLSRYGAYLIVQNADPGKTIVALGQTYFAVQTRRQELADAQQTDLEMPEDQLRLIRRSQLAINNRQLAKAAQGAGVVTARDFAIFNDHGYMGLYGGMRARDISQRKSLKKGQEISDWMNSDELTANAFRASLTRQKIEREQINMKAHANQTHYTMGQLVRETIKEAGATLPEDMIKPAKSIQQLQREEQKRLEREERPSLFDDLGDPE